jgi:hypothetical protein
LLLLLLLHQRHQLQRHVAASYHPAASTLPELGLRCFVAVHLPALPSSSVLQAAALVLVLH